MLINVESRFPPGWDEARIRQVLTHYETQSEEEACAEDEAAFGESLATSTVGSSGNTGACT
jgi:hypothetical protein